MTKPELPPWATMPRQQRPPPTPASTAPATPAKPCCAQPARESTPLGHSGEHTYAESDGTEREVYDRIAARFRGLERKLLGLESYQVRAAGRVADVDDP